MPTNTHIRRGAARRTLFVSVLLTVIAPLVVTTASGPPNHVGTDGTVARQKPTHRPSIQAAFARESYARGARARLVIQARLTSASVQLFHAGTELTRIAPRDEMRGTPVTRRTLIGRVAGRRVVRLQIGHWDSGFYYARLTGPGGRIGYAPFVLRPLRLGEHRIAVVLPTFTWQAYNFRDDDRDGDGDTWYAGADERFARLFRPYENRGVPPHYKHYDQPFLRWLLHTGRRVDYLSDSDLHSVRGGEALAQAYDLIVFPGHHEYVSRREYDAVERYRDLGGNLMFLSANNFFWRVDRRGDSIYRIRKWRDLGRPEAALIGVQYIGNDEGEHRGAWIVRRAVPWLFAGTRLNSGSELSNGGIEIDKTARSSPQGVRVIAEIPNLLGRGMTAQMTYYETARGAKVFAAGAFTLAGSVWQPPVQRLMENLWARLGNDRK